MPSNTLRDSLMEVGGGNRGGSQGGRTQISPAPFLSTPHSCPIARKRKPRSGGASWPRAEHGEPEFERRPPHWALLSGTLVRVLRNTWDSGCWTECGGTNLHPGFAAHTSPLNSRSSIKLLVQCRLLREASAIPGRPGGPAPKKASPSGCVTVPLGLLVVSEGRPTVSIAPSHSEDLSSRQTMGSWIFLEHSASHSFCQTLSLRALCKELA